MLSATLRGQDSVFVARSGVLYVRPQCPSAPTQRFIRESAALSFRPFRIPCRVCFFGRMHEVVLRLGSRVIFACVPSPWPYRERSCIIVFKEMLARSSPVGPSPTSRVAAITRFFYPVPLDLLMSPLTHVPAAHNPDLHPDTDTR